MRRRSARRAIKPKRPDGRTLRAVRGRHPARRGTGRRQEILDAAAILMQRRGFVGTTVEDVADHLDLTKAAFYYYLSNKEELLFEIATQTLAIARERITTIERSAAAPQAKLEQVVDAVVRLVAERPAFFTVYFEEKEHLAPAHLRAVTKTERGLVESVERVLRDGVSKRVFRRTDPAVGAFIVFGMCFWTYKWYRPDGRLSLDEISTTLQGAATRAFAL